MGVVDENRTTAVGVEADDTSGPSTGPGSTSERPDQSFEEFFAEVWPWLLRLAGLLVQDADAGEDIAQEVLASVYATWGRADNPEAYLRTCIANACRNWHRRHRLRATKLPLVASADRVEFVARELADAIARLPFRQRAVVVLRYHFSLSEREIANTIGCRPGTVKSLASRALASLEKELPR